MKTKPIHNKLSLKMITVLRGSLITLRRRCAKPTCHCAQGQPHESPALSFSQKGKTRILTLTPSEVPAVRRCLKHYHQAQDHLSNRADKGLAILERYLKSVRRR